MPDDPIAPLGPRNEETRMVAFQIRLPRRLLTELEEFARRDGRSVANLLRHVAERWVEEERALNAQSLAVPADLSENAPPVDEFGTRLTTQAAYIARLFLHQSDAEGWREVTRDLTERGYLRKRNDGVFVSTQVGWQLMTQPPAQDFLRRQRRAAARREKDEEK
jgi:hypothetical protein